MSRSNIIAEQEVSPGAAGARVIGGTVARISRSYPQPFCITRDKEAPDDQGMDLRYDASRWNSRRRG